MESLSCSPSRGKRNVRAKTCKPPDLGQQLQPQDSRLGQMQRSEVSTQLVRDRSCTATIKYWSGAGFPSFISFWGGGGGGGGAIFTCITGLTGSWWCWRQFLPPAEFHDFRRCLHQMQGSEPQHSL